MSASSGIAWREWDAETFEMAAKSGKPILLSISAVWCHWCHVMDQTTYADPRVAQEINERFIPVRVDNDRRPDINARYNQGGWPTTAFLTPEGALLTGATYVPPQQMLEALERVATFYHSNREHIAQQRPQQPERKTPPGALRETMIARILEEISDAYDPEYGGFGFDQKFPMIDVLEFLLQEYRAGKDQRVYEMLARTLNAMSSGGTYDHVEGGFFRYSTTRDWSVPHFEKMSEDNAGLIAILAQLLRATGSREFRDTLVSSLEYIRTRFLNAQTHFFAGSQDADEAYYSLPLQARRAREAPYIDRTVYANWNAAMARGFAHAGFALDDDALVAQAAATLDALHQTMRDDLGLLFHFKTMESQPQVRGLLTDQAAYLAALLDVHQFSGEPRFLERAAALAARIRERFGAPEGGYYDRLAIDEFGSLARRDRPLPEGCSIAESLLRLAILLEDDALRPDAERTLASFAGSYGKLGIFAAPFGRALRRFFHDAASATLVGTPAETAEMREAALSLPDALICVRTKSANGETHPAAYICRSKRCAAPVLTAAAIRAAYDSIA